MENFQFSCQLYAKITKMIQKRAKVIQFCAMKNFQFLEQLVRKLYKNLEKMCKSNTILVQLAENFQLLLQFWTKVICTKLYRGHAFIQI